MMRSRETYSKRAAQILIELGAKAIECTLSERPSPRDLRGIERLRAFSGEDAVEASFVACTTEQPFEIGSGVVARSGWSTWEV